MNVSTCRPELSEGSLYLGNNLLWCKGILRRSMALLRMTVLRQGCGERSRQTETGNERNYHNEMQSGPHLGFTPEQHESCRHAGSLPQVYKKPNTSVAAMIDFQDNCSPSVMIDRE